MEEVIRVSHLTKSYNKMVALKDFGMVVQRGMVYGLLGANGAGKSTAIECILGTKHQDDGIITILGMDPKNNRKKIFERVGVQFQEGKYQTKIKVGELCRVTQSLYNEAINYIELLKLFDLEKKINYFIEDLSGGQKQKLFVVLALIPNPEIVFLDELTTGLDVKARRDVWSCLLKLKEQGLTVVLTSHFMDEVVVLCDQICILKKGETVFQGSVQKAIENSPYEKLEDAYLWYAYDEEVKTDENI